MVARGLGNRSHKARGKTITERLFLAGIGQDSHWRTAEHEVSSEQARPRFETAGNVFRRNCRGRLVTKGQPRWKSRHRAEEPAVLDDRQIWHRGLSSEPTSRVPLLGARGARYRS